MTNCERCPAVTDAIGLLACYTYELLSYWEQPCRLCEALIFFLLLFPAVWLYSVVLFFLETEADWNCSCSSCLKEKEQEFINHITTCSTTKRCEHSGLAAGPGSNSDVRTCGTGALPSSSMQPGSLTFGSCPTFSFAVREL